MMCAFPNLNSIYEIWVNKWEIKIPCGNFVLQYSDFINYTNRFIYPILELLYDQTSLIW